MDPFILREQFKVPKGGNLSSAALSTSILPGQGMEAAGKQAGAAFKKLNEIAGRRHDNKMSLRAMENSRKMGEMLVKEYRDLEVASQRNPETGEYNPLRLENGEEGDYNEVWAEKANNIRDSFLSGNDSQDDPFLRHSASMFQSFAIRGLEASIDYSRKHMVDSFERSVNIDLNRIELQQRDYLTEVTDNLVDLEIMGRNHYSDTRAAMEDVSELKIPSDDKDNLYKFVGEKYTEGYLNTLLRRDMWESAEKFMENGLKTKFGMGKDDSMFYLSAKKSDSIRDQIKVIQRKLTGGISSQLSHYRNQMIKQYEIGKADLGNLTWKKWEELNTQSGRDPFFFNRALAEREVAIDYATLYEKLGVTPFAEHEKQITDFSNKHLDGLASEYTVSLNGKLNTLRENLYTAFMKSGADYVIKFDPASREAMETAIDEPDKSKQPELLQKAIKISLDSQERYLPGEKADILTIEQIEQFNDTFNQRTSASKQIGLDGFHNEVKEFFRRYGDYGGKVLNELKDPTEGRESADSITKLKSEIGIASIYGNTRVFNMIIGSSQDAEALRKMPWKLGSAKAARIDLMKGVTKFYKSMGYAKFRDFGESTMFRIAEAYNLGLTRQAGELDPAKFVEQTLNDLIENKWFFHENAKGGAFGFNEDVKYLSIPKQDNEGKEYDYKSASKALDNIRQNPDILGIGKLIGGDTPSEGITIYKNAGGPINSGDGSGFMLAYSDEANMNKISIISDKVFPWDTFNADNYPKAFDFPVEPTVLETAKTVVKPMLGATKKQDISGRALIIKPGKSGTSFSQAETIKLAEKGNVEVVSGHRELERQHTIVDTAVRKVKDSLTDYAKQFIYDFLTVVQKGTMNSQELTRRFNKLSKTNIFTGKSDDKGIEKSWLWTEVFEPFINYDPIKRLNKKKK